MNPGIKKSYILILLAGFFIFAVSLVSFQHFAFADWELTGEEDYVFDGKTFHFKYYDGRRDQYLIKKGLIDEGLLEGWRGEPLPDSSETSVRFIGGGTYKRNYEIYFGKEKPFVVGIVFNYDEIPVSMSDQFTYFMGPAYDYWKLIVPEEEIPVPRPGSVVTLLDEYGATKTVYTRGYIKGQTRNEYEIFLKEEGFGAMDIHNKFLREESASYYKIWKATGYRFGDLGNVNVIYEKDKLGRRIPKYFDFDIVFYTGTTFKDMFNYLKQELAGYVVNELPATPAHEVQILLGLYNGMRADGMTDQQIIDKLLGELTLIADGDALDEVVAVIKDGRNIDEWEYVPAEGAEVKDIEITRRGVRKALIQGLYGLEGEILHGLFQGEEDFVIINSIKARYYRSICVRDYYVVELSTNKGTRSAIISVENERISFAERQQVMAEFDAWKKALLEQNPNIGLAAFGEKPSFEYLTPESLPVTKFITAEDYRSGAFALELLKLLDKGSEDYLAVLEAEAEAYAEVYKATQEPLMVQGISRQNAVLGYPKEMLITGGPDVGYYEAIPLNFAGMNNFCNYSPSQFIDYYLIAIAEYLNYPETFFKSVEKVLGISFLEEAAANSAFAALINTYLGNIAADGIITIDELLTAKSKTTDQYGYSFLRDELWQNTLLGKTIVIDGKSYTFPAQLKVMINEVEIDYPKTYANYKKMYEIIDAALGDEAKAGSMPAFSNEQVAEAMRYVWKQNKINPSAFDYGLWNILGITSSNLETALNEYPYVTSKGYPVTPRFLILFLIQANAESGFITGVSERLFEVNEPTPQSPEKYFLIVDDYLELLRTADSYGYQNEIPVGIFSRILNNILFADVKNYLHELTHNQVEAAAFEKILAEGLDFGDKPRQSEFKFIEEGGMEVGAMKKLQVLDDVFSGKVPARSPGLTGYKIVDYIFGLFGLMKKAVSKYLPDWSFHRYSTCMNNGWTKRGDLYRDHREIYQGCAEKYQELGLGGGPDSTDFVKHYMFRCLTKGFIDPVVFLAELEREMAIIKDPVKFTFEKDGKITVTGSDGREELVSRELFKNWYCDGGEIYSFDNGLLVFGESETVTYIIKGANHELVPPFTLLVNELGNYPFYFIYYPDKVEMYYKTVKLGSAAFYLSQDGKTILIDTLSVSTTLVSQGPIDVTEAARALILKIYNLNKEGLTQIGGKSWLGTESWAALQSLIDAGYLSYIGESGGYKYYNIESGMLSAVFTISEKGVPGEINVAGTAAAPTVTFGGVSLINNGVLPVETKFELRDGGSMVKFTTPTDSYSISLTELMNQAELAFGAGIREFSFCPAGESTTIIKFTDTAIIADGISHPVADKAAFWLEQVEYTTESGAKAFRWQTHYRAPNALMVPDAFKYTCEADIDLLVISRGRGEVTRALYNVGAYPTDLEVSYVIKKAGSPNMRYKIYVPYTEFVEKVLPSMPGWYPHKPVLFGNGYMMDLGGGNRVWFSSDVSKPEIWGEGPMFKNLNGVSLDGKVTANSIKMLSMANQEFILSPNKPLWGLGIYEAPVEPVVIKLGTIEERVVFGGKVGKWRMNVGVGVNQYGEEVVLMNYPVEKITFEQTLFRQRLARAIKILRSPLGGAVVFGGIDTVFVVVQYIADENYTNKMLYGDLWGNAAFMGTWWACGEAVQYLSKRAAGGLARIGLAGLGIAVVPASILAGEFYGAYKHEVYRAEDVDERLFNITVTLETKAERAWIETVRDLTGWLFEHKFETKNRYREFDDAIAIELWDGELELLVEEGQVSSETGQLELEEITKTYLLDNAYPTAKEYSLMYKEEVLDAIVEAVAVNMVAPYKNRYGWFPLFWDPNAALPVAAEDAAEAVIRGIVRLHERLATGDGVELPLPTVIGQSLFDENYSLNQLFIMARQDAEDIKSALETAKADDIAIGRLAVNYVLSGYGMFRIFYTQGIAKCDEIIALLNDPVFINSVGITSSILPNPHFEAVRGESEYSRIYNRDSSSGTSYTLPDEDTLTGIKYKWGIKAKIGTTESPESEKWEFEIE